MKYLKTKNLYRAANCIFDANTGRAFSYGWWRFVDRIGGKVVFNSYRYSVTTAGHQAKVRRLLNDLGIKIDFEIQCPAGLQELTGREFAMGRNAIGAVAHYEVLISELEAQINRPGTKKLKNAERRAQIKEYKAKIKIVQRLIKAQQKSRAA